MGSLTISNEILDKYFNFLKHLDDKAKKKLIIKLTKSIKTKPNKAFDPQSLFGAWEDDRKPLRLSAPPLGKRGGTTNHNIL